MNKKYEDYSFENDLGYDEYLWYRDHPEEAKKEKEYEFDQWQKQAIMDDKAEQEGWTMGDHFDKSTLLQDMIKGLNRKRSVKGNSTAKLNKGDKNEK